MCRDGRGHAHTTHPSNAPESLRVDLVDVAARAALGSGVAARCYGGEELWDYSGDERAQGW